MIEQTSEREVILPDGSATVRGQRLSALIGELGGLRGLLEDPWGNHHEVSLEQWADSDPEDTILAVTFEVDKPA